MICAKISLSTCANLITLVTLGSSWAIASLLVCIDLAVVRAVKRVRIMSSGLVTAPASSSLSTICPVTFLWTLSLTRRTFSQLRIMKHLW